MDKLLLNKSVQTNKISKEEAQEWFEYLEVFTDDFITKNFKWHVRHGMWPIAAKKDGAADKDPKFIVQHHTSNKQGNYKPALYRFMSSKMASSNFLIGRGENDLFYLVNIEDMSYHATQKDWLPLSVRRALGLEGRWLDETGTEICGNGGTLLFSYHQFVNNICLNRYLIAYFPSIAELKSHRFFNRIGRAGDPGPLFFLPLVEHASFNDIDLNKNDYWVQEYKNDPVKFANEGFKSWLKNLNLEDRDEWRDKRKIKITEKYLLK